jgi:hypothetical protein
MKNNSYILVILFTFLIACKEKKTSSKEPAISAVSIIKGQLNQLDTSLFKIMKFETMDGKTDTTYLKREEVRDMAKDFLSLPDISQNNYAENYTEERLIDETQNTLSITAMAKHENQEIQKQIIIVPLDKFATGNVQSIYIDRFVQTNDSLLQQKLFWEIDKYFRIGSIMQKGTQPEKTYVLKVTWE